MPISCHFRDYKALLVTRLTHVSGAIASVQTFTFTFTPYLKKTVHFCFCQNFRQIFMKFNKFWYIDGWLKLYAIGLYAFST